MKYILRYVILLFILNFVCPSQAEIVQNKIFVTRDNMKSAVQAYTDTLKKNELQFGYIKLDNIDNYTIRKEEEDNLNTHIIFSPLKINILFSDDNLSHIKLNELEIEFSGIPIYATYKPTINLEADITHECGILNPQYIIQRTNKALDSNFKNDLEKYGNILFTTLIQSSLLKNYCSPN